jgi:uncharacterized membrane protein
MGACCVLYRIVRNGRGIAFFFMRAQRTGDVRVIAAVGREVVIADAIFTASAVVLQPVTGLAMVRLAGFPLSLPWLRWSIALYVLTRVTVRTPFMGQHANIRPSRLQSAFPIGDIRPWTVRSR